MRVFFDNWDISHTKTGFYSDLPFMPYEGLQVTIGAELIPEKYLIALEAEQPPGCPRRPEDYAFVIEDVLVYIERDGATIWCHIDLPEV